MTFGRSPASPQPASSNEPFSALLHQPLFGTSLPSPNPQVTGALPLTLPPPSTGATSTWRTPPVDTVPAAIGLRLSGEEPTVRPPNSLLRDRSPLVPVLARKRKRHPFRVLFKLLVVLALFAGAAAAVWYVVLPRLHRAAWAADVEPIADQVSSGRALEWDHPIEVVAVPAAEYGSRLVSATLGIHDATADATIGEWRAMGLAEGALDLAAIGADAVPARPAFYDATADVVYELEAMAEPLRSTALRRALTEGLIAQQPGAPIVSSGSSASLAARLVAEADAASSAAAWPTPSAEADAVRLQRAALVTAAPTASRYAVDLAIGDAGLTVLFDGVADPATRAALAAMRPPTDAAILDVGRSVAAMPAPVSAGGGTQRGMAYWYYVLASRLPAAQAWQAAAAWNGDDVVVSGPGPAGGDVCVTAALATVDALGRDAMFDALTQWAAAAPPSASTTVTVTGDRIDVSSCDPGPAADTITAEPTPFGDAAIERTLVGGLDAATDAVRRCTVGAVRGYGVAAMVRSGDQAAADALMAQIRTACAAAV